MEYEVQIEFQLQNYWVLGLFPLSDVLKTGEQNVL
jgi:hypothetical protein